MSKLIAPFLAASVGACFNPQFQQGVPCSADRECPDGQICHTDDRCYDPDSLPEVDPDATLSNLEISAGTLVPAFDPQVTEYTVDLGLRVDAFTVTPTAAAPDSATIDVSGNPTESGVASVPLDLRLGDNSVDIAVTADGGESATYSIGVARGAALAQRAYVKASNTENFDSFGGANDDGVGTGDVALSGNTLAVTASGEDSNARVVNGNQNDNSSNASGAVYIFVRDGVGWSQQAYIKPSSISTNDRFGTSNNIFGDLAGGPALDLDGDILVVGTPRMLSDAGGVHVFVRSGNAWSEQDFLQASNAETGDKFGMSVAISGETLAVGAPDEASNATGINGNETDNTLPGSGAVYTFIRNGSSWQQDAYIKASNTGGDRFGASVALDADTLVVGAPNEASSASTVNGNQGDNSAAAAGAAYVFARSGGTWIQQAYLKSTNAESEDQFGASVGISGNSIVVGAPFEDSASQGDPSNNATPNSGSAYVFTRTGSSWFARAYLKASNIGADDLFGVSVAIAGRAIAVGAYQEDSSDRGVGAKPDEGAANSGAVYLFEGADNSWSEMHFIKASNTDAGDQFGVGVALTEDALVVVAPSEASSATGVNAGTGENDNSTNNAGAAYVFE